MSDRRRAALLVAILLGCTTGCANSPTKLSAAPEVHGAQNPVLAGADPHLAVVQGRFWLYPTTASAAGQPSWARLYAYVSDDLRSWSRRGPILDARQVSWIGDDGAATHYLWAPALLEANGRFYLFYSVGPQNPTPSRIGVAVADSPAGPFRDSGAPLLTGGDGFEAIDPMVFIDPPTGVAYLYAGGSAGARLRLFELDTSLMRIRREAPVDQPPGFTEGPFVHHHAGTYYLSYSSGRWNDASYAAQYATGPSPSGPWTWRGTLLSSDGRRQGPGHHSIVRNPATGEWLIAYHRWDQPGPGPFRGDRQVAIQRLEHRPDGTIAPIVMDDRPPPAALTGAGAVPSGAAEPAPP